MKHREGKMAKYDAKEIADDAMDVFKMIDKDMDLPEWLEAKITKSADYMNSVKDYLTHHMKGDVQEGYSMRDLGLSPFWKKLNPDQRQAVSIALIMGGNMSGAIKAIEKIKKGLSKDKKVKNALKMANEGFASAAQRRAAFASGYKAKGKKKKKKEGVNETTYKFKGYTASNMDELDAMLSRAGIKGTPNFNDMTYSVNKKSSKIDRIMKMKGGKKIKPIRLRGKSGMGKISHLGMESVDEVKYKGYDYKRQNRKDGLSLIVPALRKTFSNMKDLKKYIDKHGTMESVDEARGTCWVGYQQIGMKKKGNKMVPNCVKEIYWENELGESCGYTFELEPVQEAEYQGRKVKLNKIMQGDQKKFKVYVKNPKGNVVKVNFGQGGDAKGGTMRIRKSNPAARKSFRARHNCDNPGPKHKARYWSCRKW